VVLGLGLLALVVVVAGRPVDVVSAPRLDGTLTPPDAASITTSYATSTRVGQDLGELPGWLVALMQILLVLVAAFVAYLIWTLIRYAIRALLARRPRRELPAPRSVEPLPEVPEELVGERAAARRRLLLEGEPRNAIVACWLHLEESVADAGLPRRPAETSTEWMVRVLAAWEVDRVALTELGARYREARFSPHPVTEPQRQRAIELLDALHADLQRAAQVTVATGDPS